MGTPSCSTFGSGEQHVQRAILHHGSPQVTMNNYVEHPADWRMQGFENSPRQGSGVYFGIQAHIPRQALTRAQEYGVGLSNLDRSIATIHPRQAQAIATARSHSPRSSAMVLRTPLSARPSPLNTQSPQLEPWNYTMHSGARKTFQPPSPGHSDTWREHWTSRTDNASPRQVSHAASPRQARHSYTDGSPRTRAPGSPSKALDNGINAFSDPAAMASFGMPRPPARRRSGRPSPTHGGNILSQSATGWYHSGDCRCHSCHQLWPSKIAWPVKE